MTRARQQLTLLSHRQRPSVFVAQLGYAVAAKAAQPTPAGGEQAA